MDSYSSYLSNIINNPSVYPTLESVILAFRSINSLKQIGAYGFRIPSGQISSVTTMAVPAVGVIGVGALGGAATLGTKVTPDIVYKAFAGYGRTVPVFISCTVSGLKNFNCKYPLSVTLGFESNQTSPKFTTTKSTSGCWYESFTSTVPSTADYIFVQVHQHTGGEPKIIAYCILKTNQVLPVTGKKYGDNASDKTSLAAMRYDEVFPDIAVPPSFRCELINVFENNDIQKSRINTKTQMKALSILATGPLILKTTSQKGTTKLWFTIMKMNERTKSWSFAGWEKEEQLQEALKLGITNNKPKVQIPLLSFVSIVASEENRHEFIVKFASSAEVKYDLVFRRVSSDRDTIAFALDLCINLLRSAVLGTDNKSSNSKSTSGKSIDDKDSNKCAKEISKISVKENTKSTPKRGRT